MLTPSYTSLAQATKNDALADRSRIAALVHKHDPRNVLLTDIRGRGSDRLICTGRVPSDHPLFNEGGKNPGENVLFYSELARQASLAMTHVLFHTSLDEAFIFERSEAALTGAMLRLPEHARTDSIDIEISVRETSRRKNGEVGRVIADHVMLWDGEEVFRSAGFWTIQTAAVYKRLRRAQIGVAAMSQPCNRVAELPHRLRRPASNVVISKPEYRDERSEACVELLVDFEHPYFFDHPCDHVPGMLLQEGCAQLALETAARCGSLAGRLMVTEYVMSFTQFVEFDLPTLLTVQPSSERGCQTHAGQQKYEITASQGGAVSGVASITVGSFG